MGDAGPGPPGAQGLLGTSLPLSSSTLLTVKEEKIDFLDEHEPEEEKKYEPPKRGRTRSLSKKSTEKVDMRAKLERSRQSARECRARKKLRYQYLEEVISETEKAIFSLRREMDMLKIWAKELDDGKLPENLVQYRTSCVEKKLTNPFKLQSHHHIQIAQQRQEAAAAAAASGGGASATSTPPPNSIQLLGSGGGICGGTSSSGIQMSSSPSNSLGFGGLSLSPTGHMATPYLTSLGRSSRTSHHHHHSSGTGSASASHSSVSPP